MIPVFIKVKYLFGIGKCTYKYIYLYTLYVLNLEK